MALTIRQIAAITLLVLLAAAALGLLPYRGIEMSIPSAEFGTVASIPVVAIVLAWLVAHNSATGPVETRSNELYRIANELREAALADESNRRRALELAV